MKKPNIIFLLVMFVFSLSCQSLIPTPAPPRQGTVLSNCADITKAIRSLQATDIPQGLTDKGSKQGDEFDVNEYFKVLQNLSMQDGYVLDYVYHVDGLGAFPILAARPVDEPPYIEEKDLPEGSELTSYLNYVEVQDTEQGYFEYLVLLNTANQFYLFWHANYNDREIVCDREHVDAIAKERNTGDFGMEFDREQMRLIRNLNNIEPLVKLSDSIAIVELITFSKWGGFYRMTYTIDRNFPHAILDVKEENIVPYDCGIMF